MKQPLISIIMGVYNSEKTIDESIKSVINQTYENWELIICDDGSIDNTINKIEHYINQNKKIKLLKNERNMGLAYSLNKCLKIAKGEFIARHDADDICLPFRLERQITYITENEIEILGSAVEYFDDNGIWGVHYTKEKPSINDVFKESSFSHPTIMVKKNVIEEVGYYSVSKITYRTEDYDLFSKIYAAGYKGENLQEVLYQVRRGKDAYNRRKFKYRIDESKCKLIAFKRLKIGFKKFYIVLVPIIKGLIPTTIFKIYHTKKFKGK